MRYYKQCYWILLICASACNKLKETVYSDLAAPTTLAELDGLFNNELVGFTPGLPDLMTNDLYLLTAFWQQRDLVQRNAYLWKADLYQGDTSSGDYELCGTQTKNALITLERLQKIAPTGDTLHWQTLKGMAYFYRALAVYEQAQLYAPVYNNNTAITDIGVPLRQSSATDEKVTSATIKNTYEQLVGDCQQAASLLLPRDAKKTGQPSQTAAYGLLARIYLSMRDYPNAALYADKCLQQYSTLLDFNTPGITLRNNPEIIFLAHANAKIDALTLSSQKDCMADTLLYRSYAANDMRKQLFFELKPNGYPTIKKGYDGGFYIFTGMATDEQWLIRAEARAQTGDLDGALSDLNTLRRNRYGSTQQQELQSLAIDQLIDSIITERRKELPYRGLRWTDIRRFNKMGYNIVMNRNLNDSTYVLPANDARYVLPFPPGAAH